MKTLKHPGSWTLMHQISTNLEMIVPGSAQEVDVTINMKKKWIQKQSTKISFSGLWLQEVQKMGLRRALCRNNSGVDVKCPLTGPAKPSKSRITRMALISSMSKQNATPKAKAKQALTTPEAVPSVRNQKTTENEGSNSRAVAKTLVFGSPKKGEMNKPLKNLSAGMKKLETTSRRKQVLGYDRPLPSDTSRKQFRRREVKIRVFDGLCSNNDKVQAAKSSKYNNNKTLVPKLVG
ncbi:uncharacterized protein [Euphorbia lathyris]|uniref:uncharacterized protein n=1 Tax=Euphorbia lathyris TaxID=212925 RepID=UPI0033134F1E